MSDADGPLSRRSRQSSSQADAEDTEDALVTLPSLPTEEQRAAAARAAAAAAVATTGSSAAVSSAASLRAATAAYQTAIASNASSNGSADDAIGDGASASSSDPPVCPYLSTVNRERLDFDFEPICSVSLSPLNVYACLVCGVYYQGKGKHTPAFAHSVEAEHHVFLSLATRRIFCLPDGYEVVDPSLADIARTLAPTVPPQLALALDGRARSTASARSSAAQQQQHRAGQGPVFEAGVVVIPATLGPQQAAVAAAAAAGGPAGVPAGPGVLGSARAFDGSWYLPGIVGLSDLQRCEWFAASAQLLLRVAPLRNFFFNPANYELSPSALVQSWGEFTRKVFWPHLFRRHVSPHLVLQAVSTASARRFGPAVAADPFAFLQWFLNALHKDLTTPVAAKATATGAAAAAGGLKRPAAGAAAGTAAAAAGAAGAAGASAASAASMVSLLLRGEVAVTTVAPATASQPQTETVAMSDSSARAHSPPTTSKVPCLCLSLPLPEPSLDELQEHRGSAARLDQRVRAHVVPLANLLARFNGRTEITRPDGSVYTQQLSRLPRYLVLHYQRFRTNEFFKEKNPTLVSFPLTHLDLAPYMSPDAAARAAAAAAAAEAAAAGACPAALAALSVSELRARIAHANAKAAAVEARHGPARPVSMLTVTKAAAAAAAASASASSVAVAAAEGEEVLECPGYRHASPLSTHASPTGPDAATGLRGAVEKSDLVAAAAAAHRRWAGALRAAAATRYRLVANVVHDGAAGSGRFRALVRHEASGKWVETQGLRVEGGADTEKLVALTQAYVQLYELEVEGEDDDRADGQESG